MFFFLAFGHQSRLKRGINITPFSLENLESSQWPAFSLVPWSQLGLSRTLCSEGCHQGPAHSSSRGVGRSKQRGASWQCKCCVYDANQKTQLCVEETKSSLRKTGKRVGAVSGFSAYLLLMTKAAMRITTRTTLPETETSRTVELAPSPMILEGTGKDSYTSITLGEVPRVRTSDCHKF